MDLEIDYTFAPKSIVGSGHYFFIGTKDYFFVLPYNKISVEYRGSALLSETKDMYYEGLPLQEFLLEKIKEPNLSVKEFEAFIINESFADAFIVDINTDIEIFKVQANFMGSGIYVKYINTKKWDFLAVGFKKYKNSIKSFYANHPKLKK